MRSDHLVRVFEGQDFIKESVEMFCRDRLRGMLGSGSPETQQMGRSALDTLCWDVVALQGKSFPFSVLVDKCSAALVRSSWEPIRQLRPDDLANEICSPVGGW